MATLTLPDDLYARLRDRAARARRTVDEEIVATLREALSPDVPAGDRVKRANAIRSRQRPPAHGEPTVVELIELGRATQDAKNLGFPRDDTE